MTQLMNFFVLDKKTVIYDSRTSDPDIKKHTEYTEVNDKEFKILCIYLTDRMIEPAQIKHN